MPAEYPNFQDVLFLLRNQNQAELHIKTLISRLT